MTDYSSNIRRDLASVQKLQGEIQAQRELVQKLRAGDEDREGEERRPELVEAEEKEAALWMQLERTRGVVESTLPLLRSGKEPIEVLLRRTEELGVPVAPVRAREILESPESAAPLPKNGEELERFWKEELLPLIKEKPERVSAVLRYTERQKTAGAAALNAYLLNIDGSLSGHTQAMMLTLTDAGPASHQMSDALHAAFILLDNDEREGGGRSSKEVDMVNNLYRASEADVGDVLRDAEAALKASRQALPTEQCPFDLDKAREILREVTSEDFKVGEESGHYRESDELRAEAAKRIRVVARKVFPSQRSAAPQAGRQR